MKQNFPVPAFLSKLWTLLEEESTNDLICWTQDGFSFVVLDELRFSKEILPLYFKHSNMASFVRQLNMYGFHKVVHVDSGLLRDAVNSQSVEFQHEHFQRSQAHLLSLIRRKVSVSRVNDDAGPMSQAMVEVSQVRRWYNSSHVQLLALCRDNHNLWREVDALRQKYQHQHQIIRKIIRFIATTVQSNTVKGMKRKLPIIDSSGERGEFRGESPATKLRRSVSVQSPRSHSCMDSRDGVYSNRVIFSDITHMLQPNSNLKRCEDDPLALIDSSLAAISCSDSVDLLSEFLGPVEDAPDHTATSSQITERKPEAQLREETPLHTQTGLCGGGDADDEDGGVGSDILPSLLQLAQEASALSMPTSVSLAQAPCVPPSMASDPHP